MPSPLTTRMNAIKDALALARPARVVTRDYVDPGQRKAADLQAWVYTLIAMGEKDFTNVPQYNARDGKQDLFIAFDLKLPEAASATPSQIEDAEFDAVDEIVAFLNNLPATVCQLELDGYVQSGQMRAPYASVLFAIRYIP